MAVNYLYLADYGIFAAFLALFAVEIGMGLFAVLDYDKYRDAAMRYILPIWGIDGTFLIFYIVNFEATFPNILEIVGRALIVPAMVAALFIVLRNAFIIHWEFSGERNARRFVRFYAASTIIAAFLGIAVFSSGVSGVGINTSNGAANLAAVLFDPYSISVFVAILLFIYFAASVLFSSERKGLPIASAALGMVLIGVASNTYANYLLEGLMHNIVYLIAILVVFGACAGLYLKGSRYAKYLTIVWLYFAILFFGILQYPHIFGSSDITSYIASGTEAAGVRLITGVGGLLLVLFIIAFLYSKYKDAKASA